MDRIKKVVVVPIEMEQQIYNKGANTCQKNASKDAKKVIQAKKVKKEETAKKVKNTKVKGVKEVKKQKWAKIK